MYGAISSYDRNLYNIVSSASLLARIYICYQTVEKMPIFADTSINFVFGQVISIYSILWALCYPTVGYIATTFEIESPTIRSIVYFVLYLLLAGIYLVILFLLTNIFGVLPIR